MTRKQANRLLDWVRAGGEAPESEILFALWMTGEFELFARQTQIEASEINHGSLDQ